VRYPSKRHPRRPAQCALTEAPNATMTEALSARTRELLDSVMAGETIFSGSSSFACATARKAQPHPDSARRLVMAAKADDDSERLLTPRLMSLLEPAAPQAAEVGAVHASLESLQSTLGAAYMLLAAECKAETLEAQVSLARARLAEHVTAEDGLREAYESCVSDFASLRQVVDSARAQAETLASALAQAGTLASLPAEARTACQALLGMLGSESRLVSEGAGGGVRLAREAPEGEDEEGEDDEEEEDEEDELAEDGEEAHTRRTGSKLSHAQRSRLRAQLRDAEEHQRAFAAHLHSREAQLALARSELAAFDGERERYADIVSEAEKKIARAAGAPGERTARGVEERAEAAGRAAAEAEARLEARLAEGVRLTAEWIAADRRAHASTKEGPGKEGIAAAALGKSPGGKEVLREAGNTTPAGHGAPKSPGRAMHAETPAAATRRERKERRMRRHASADELRRSLRHACTEVVALRLRREELSAMLATLRDMLRSMELERAARIQLHETLARDFTLQKAALRRCVREQDIVCEVALHKLELLGGAELAAALTAHLHSLRASAHQVFEGEGSLPDEGIPKRPAGARVPEALAAAVLSVQRFLLGHVPRRAEPPTPARAPPPMPTPFGGPPLADVERLGGLAQSVLEHIHTRLSVAAAKAEAHH
jgi:hypothetical protein